MKKNMYFEVRSFWIFLFLITALLTITSCEPPNEPTEESHGPDAEPGYETLFDPAVVKQIDMIFEPEDWQALMDDMTELVGPFGQITNPPPGSYMEMIQEAANACQDLEAGDACEFKAWSLVRDGICVNNQRNNRLVCESNQTTDILTRNPIYIPCTIKFNGLTWEHVGMRFKGNSSLFTTWSTESYKLPIRLDFDKYEDDYPETKNQRFYGFDKITFASGFRDPSLMREMIAADAFRDAGVPAAKTAFYRVHVDYGEGSIYFGLYTMIEDPNGPMLDTQFGDDDGNLYKPDGPGASFATFDTESFVKKTNKEEADWSDVKGLYDILHTDQTDPSAWRSDLESVFDADGFLHYLAVNNFVMNWDSYGRYGHNYYLYNDSDVLKFITWDHNMSFFTTRAQDAGEELPDQSHIDDQWPLIRSLLDDPVYFSHYIFFIHETLHGAFEAERINGKLQSTFDLIKPHAVGPRGEEELHTLLARPAAFRNSLSPLMDFVQSRRTLSEQLLSDVGYSPSPVVIDEIYYHPPEEQGDDYEFVELTNIGDKAVDLSGYRFSGIDFQFPAGTAIAPGEYLLVCKAANIYQDKAAQVFQWDSGKLSNKGEVVALIDTNGNFADYIQYNDRFNWPEKADGQGYSLELTDNASVNTMAENWQAKTLGGTPGSAYQP